MKNTFGKSIALTLFGESHGELIGAVIDGLAPGIKIDEDYIKGKLTQRRPYGKISTSRVEADEFNIVSGAFNGYTTGAPLTVLIKNTSVRSTDYSGLRDTPRPSHADYTAEIKYGGFQDYRGGGHFSGRLTAAIVAAGGIVSRALYDKGIQIGTHISSLHGINDRPFIDTDKDISLLNNELFPVLDSAAADKMRSEILKAEEDGDSVGGVLETVITGVPVGVGEPWFDTVEGILSQALFSVPAVKGVEFGAGFSFAEMLGSEANDQFVTDGNNIGTKTNNNGGINGGITNGMPIIFRCAVKPTPSIFKEQSTVSLSRMENTTLQLKGRHDPAIIHRARAVIDALSALSIADLLVMKYGTDWLANTNS